jgi:hypothetical protein
MEHILAPKGFVSGPWDVFHQAGTFLGTRTAGPTLGNRVPTVGGHQFMREQCQTIVPGEGEPDDAAGEMPEAARTHDGRSC